VLALALVAVLRFTVPTQEADTSQAARIAGSTCEAGPHRERISRVRLRRVVCYRSWVWELIREKPVIGGATETLAVDDSRCATYFVTVLDSAGNESCERGITVGTPPVAVGDGPLPGEALYDVVGRRAEPPLRSGWYCSRNGKWIKIR
jgi:hypothetical protein